MILGLLALLAGAQQPSQAWRTVETEHFRMHYPRAAEGWSLAAAERLEAMRARVAEQVGNNLEHKVTVVVRDPYATSNGMAVPFIRRPRTELWLTGPEADSVIGWNRRWDEGLIVHEDTHLVHLAAPSRGGVDRVLDVLTGVGPVARKSPAWVIEGYATVVEGDQTGYGRPYAAAEAAVMRRLAIEGRLPSYEELSGSPRWGGRGFRYGIGNAYLRWLREREGPDSLTHLWIRMRAKKLRSFEQAFEGVFRDDPKALYGRFAAETTADAMALERQRPARTGTRWIDLEEGTGAPTLSADGDRIALVVTRNDKATLAVWDADEDASKAQEAWERRVSGLLENDPQDIPSKRAPEPDLGTPTLRIRKDRTPHSPRWLDSDRLLFTSRVPHPSGQLRRDLFTWNPETLEERRITRWQDVHTADPAPDGSWALAVHEAWGESCLARVELQGGQVTCLTDKRHDVLYDAPRVHADGERVLWLEQREGPWTLYTARVAEQGLSQVRAVPMPLGAQLSGPVWHPTKDAIVASIGLPHLLEIGEIDLASGETRLWTRAHGGAIRPAVTDSHVYWIDNDAEGQDLHRAALPGTEGAAEPEPLPEPPDGLILATRPVPVDIPLPATASVTPRRYGLGRTEGRPLLGSQLSRFEARVAAAVRLGDVINRHEILVRAGTHVMGDERRFGGRATAVLRTLPFELQAETWLSQDAQTDALRLGAGVSARDTHSWAWGYVGAEGGGFVDPGLSGATGRHAGHAQLIAGAWEPTVRALSARMEAHTTVGALGSDELGAIAGGQASIGLFRQGIQLGTRLDVALGGAPDLRLGGLPDPFLPDAWQADRIRVPALGPDADEGRSHLAVDAALGSANGGLYIARHSIDEDLIRGPAFTLVGLRAQGSLPAQPLVGLPRARTQAGIACALSSPIAGVPDKPCQRVDHYTAWLGLRWRLD